VKEFEITVIETIRKRAIVVAPDWEAAEEMADTANLEIVDWSTDVEAEECQ